LIVFSSREFDDEFFAFNYVSSFAFTGVPSLERDYVISYFPFGFGRADFYIEFDETEVVLDTSFKAFMLSCEDFMLIDETVWK
jgi:hypothetical protein